MIPFFRPWLGEEEQNAVLAPLKRAWLTQGTEVNAFEAELAEYLDVPHVVAVSSGTAALFLMLVALDIGPGDEVLVPSHSFIASANVIRQVGAEVVFVDIEPETLNLDPVAVEASLTSRTKAIMAVHQFGMPCDLHRLTALAQQKGLLLLEDAACAIGSQVQVDNRWERIGRPHGAAACFSFHPRKLLTTGEGGAVVTRDPDLADRIRRLRQHGLQAGPDPTKPAVFLEVGYNFRMSDVLAAIGRVQLSRLDELLTHRQSQVSLYSSAFTNFFQKEPSWARSNRQTLALRLDTDSQPIVDKLARQGIIAGVGIVNSHQTPAYSDSPRKQFLHSEKASKQTLLLPLYHELSTLEIAQIIGAVEEALS